MEPPFPSTALTFDLSNKYFPTTILFPSYGASPHSIFGLGFLDRNETYLHSEGVFAVKYKVSFHFYGPGHQETTVPGVIKAFGLPEPLVIGGVSYNSFVAGHPRLNASIVAALSNQNETPYKKQVGYQTKTFFDIGYAITEVTVNVHVPTTKFPYFKFVTIPLDKPIRTEIYVERGFGKGGPA